MMEDANEERRETSVRDLLGVVFRRKWIVLAFLIASVIVVALVHMFSPTLYESSAQVLLSLGKVQSAYDSRVMVTLPWEEELNSEMEAVTSDHVLKAAQKVLDDGKITGTDGVRIKVDPTTISCNTVGKSTILLITTRVPDPMAAQQTTRAVAQAYTDFRLTVRMAPELEAYFHDEIDGLRQQLEEWEQRRADFLDQQSLSGSTDDRPSLLSIRQQTEFELTKVRQDLAAEQMRVDLVHQSLQQPMPDSASGPYTFTEGNNDSEAILQIKRELVTKTSALLSARAEYQDDHPIVLDL
jgi:uncharacterized protein involved in exopolysaccharide biosynthesis